MRCSEVCEVGAKHQRRPSVASMKPALDAIVRAGILSDDNPGVIDLVLRAVKVSKMADERVIVTIQPIS